MYGKTIQVTILFSKNAKFAYFSPIFALKNTLFHPFFGEICPGQTARLDTLVLLPYPPSSHPAGHPAQLLRVLLPALPDFGG